MKKIQLLDCTLRDGGYVNDWLFGHNNIVNIFERLVSAGVDIIETGFIDDRRPYDYDRTIMPDSESVEKIFYNLDKGNSMLVGMIDYGTCDIDNIVPCDQSILSGIRVIFKKHLREEAMDYCRQLKEKGYKVFSQLVSITSYDDDELMDLIRIANDVKPYAVSIVDTYGLMHQENLIHYFGLLNAHLDKGISIGYHSHNNFQMAYANCIEFLTQDTDRDMIIDGTIYGMGKSAGNVPTELLTMQLNQRFGKSYDTTQILEAIDGSVMQFYRKSPWGYNMFYYISASNDCHPNYVSYLMDKRTLSVRSINNILDNISKDKKLIYDEQYIEKCYIKYQNNDINDEGTYKLLAQELNDYSIVLIAPGRSLLSFPDFSKYLDKIVKYKIISINFIPDMIKTDYLFLTNSRRQLMLSTTLAQSNDHYKIIASSNVTSMNQDYSFVFNYSSLLDDNKVVKDNPFLMLLKILKRIKVKDVYLIGFDGYNGGDANNYISQDMEYKYTDEQARMLNEYVGKCIADFKKNIPIDFLTESKYEQLIQ